MVSYDPSSPINLSESKNREEQAGARSAADGARAFVVRISDVIQRHHSQLTEKCYFINLKKNAEIKLRSAVNVYLTANLLQLGDVEKLPS